MYAVIVKWRKRKRESNKPVCILQGESNRQEFSIYIYLKALALDSAKERER